MAKDSGSRFGCATVIALIVVVLGAGAAHLWSRHPLRVAERISGLDLPSGVRLIHHEAVSGDFIPDGYSLRVYRLPREFYDHVMANCESLGYKLGRLSPNDRQGFLVEKHYNTSISSCYLFTYYPAGFEMSLLSEARLPAEGSVGGPVCPCGPCLARRKPVQAPAGRRHHHPVGAVRSLPV